MKSAPFRITGMWSEMSRTRPLAPVKMTIHDMTYPRLREAVRRELAEHDINDPSLSLQEISFLLGLSEPSAFSRVYRRWTGQSPSAARFAAS